MNRADQGGDGDWAAGPAAAGFALCRDSFGRMVLTFADGTVHHGVVPARAFPILDPQGGLALLSADGHELVWIEDPASLPRAVRTLVEEELAAREFMPKIDEILDVSSFATPSTWRVATDRGETRFVLKGEEDIRHLPGGMLLISDSHGLQYLIRHLPALNRASRRILDRFL